MCPYRDKITKLVRLVRNEQPDDRPLASQTDPGRRRADLSLTDLGNFSARYSGPRVRNRVTAIGRMVKRRWPYVSTFCMETLNTRHDQLPLLGIEIYGSREFEEQRVCGVEGSRPNLLIKANRHPGIEVRWAGL